MMKKKTRQAPRRNSAVGVTNGAEPELIWVMAVAIALLAATQLLRARRMRTSLETRQ